MRERMYCRSGSMGAPLHLSEAFASVLRREPDAALEPQLRRMHQSGARAWPEVKLDVESYVRHLAARVGADVDPAVVLRTIHASDLYLACACARGDPRAIAALDQAYVSRVPGFLQPIDRWGTIAEEVMQELRG